MIISDKPKGHLSKELDGIRAGFSHEWRFSAETGSEAF